MHAHAVSQNVKGRFHAILERPGLKSYLAQGGLGIAAAAVAGLVQFALRSQLVHSDYILFIPAILFSSRVAGFLAGILATIAGAGIGILFSVMISSSTRFAYSPDWFAALVFIGVGLSVSSVTALSRRRSTELTQAREEAERLSGVRSGFLDVAAHELRTPTTTLSLLLQYTERQLLKGHPVDLATLVRLRSQAARLSRLVADLFDVSRLDHHFMVLRLERTDLKLLVAECVNNFKMREPDRQLVYVEPSELFELDLDPSRIVQVLSNLIDNAIKYTDPSWPIEVRLEGKVDVIRISVIDHSVGISAEQQQSLFEPLTRGTSDRVEQASGLGLGLFISRGIVELHGGTIGVVSVAGVGSVFYFELPRSLATGKMP